MQQSPGFEKLFSSVRQAVIGTDGNEIIFANSAAKRAAGYDPTGRAAKSIIPQDILESDSESFVCAAAVLGRRAGISVVRQEDLTILFIDFIDKSKPALNITRHIIGNLRGCAMGLKMTADRCFSMLEDGKVPETKCSSVLYRYYYDLVRTLTQLDTADLIERGEVLFSPVPTDLVRLCSELTDTVSLLSSGFGVNIRFYSDEEALVAVVDPSKIEQLLLNLFSNSLKHTTSGNNISLTLSRSGNRIILSLDDDGEGIPQEILSNIFILPDDSGELNLNRSGNGLGLYISFGIAHLHNGVLLIESREGFGTKVRVMLPTDEEPSPKFNCPESEYGHSGLSTILTELADILPSECYGFKYED